MRPHEQNSNTDVASRLVTSLLDSAREARVTDVRIGLGYTGVQLDDGRLGVAFTFGDQARCGNSIFKGIRPLANRRASDLLVLLQSWDLIEAGVGLACANALANQGGRGYLEGDILEQLDLRPEDNVGMVGHFGPLVRPLQQRARSLTIFEQVDQPTGLLRPQEEAAEVLPRCQVALITGTSIINHTIDTLLEAAEACREVVVLGASTPLWADAFSGRNVTLLSGVVARDAQGVLRVVSEGGGMRLFKSYIGKVSLKIIDNSPAPQ